MEEEVKTRTKTKKVFAEVMRRKDLDGETSIIGFQVINKLVTE